MSDEPDLSSSRTCCILGIERPCARRCIEEMPDELLAELDRVIANLEQRIAAGKEGDDGPTRG